MDDVDDRYASNDGEVVRREGLRHLRAEGHACKAGQQSHDHRWKQIGHEQGAAWGSKGAKHGDFAALTAHQAFQRNRQHEGGHADQHAQHDRLHRSVAFEVNPEEFHPEERRSVADPHRGQSFRFEGGGQGFGQIRQGPAFTFRRFGEVVGRCPFHVHQQPIADLGILTQMFQQRGSVHIGSDEAAGNGNEYVG